MRILKCQLAIQIFVQIHSPKKSKSQPNPLFNCWAHFEENAFHKLIWFFFFCFPGVMIFVKLWVHRSVKVEKLSWGWDTHCVVSISSRDPNSSSIPQCVCLLIQEFSALRDQICPINLSVPKSPTVQQYLMGRHINQVWLYFWIYIHSSLYHWWLHVSKLFSVTKKVLNGSKSIARYWIWLPMPLLQIGAAIMDTERMIPASR